MGGAWHHVIPITERESSARITAQHGGRMSDDMIARVEGLPATLLSILDNERPLPPELSNRHAARCRAASAHAPRAGPRRRVHRRRQRRDRRPRELEPQARTVAWSGSSRAAVITDGLAPCLAATEIGQL